MAASNKNKAEKINGEVPETGTQPEAIIQPVTTTATDQHKDLLAPEPAAFEPKPGEYHLVSIGANGEEVPGSDFSVGEKTYNRTFKKNPAFIVKKNPNS